ncbi:MAG: AsmA family protein, partial [Gammaproteobacteria bacterium]|nr:AsmA family protein [Gammaproteobacteria bacterium]
MKRIFKILLGLIGAVILLLVLAAFVLPLIYDKEDLKAAIAREVRDQTGRDLSIDGALDFSVFPWLALEVADLSLGNAEGFGEQPFAEIGEARVGVALMPLLRKQISVDEITLDGLQLNLAVDARGKNNWDDLAATEESGTAADTGPGLFSSKRVAGLNIRDANVDFHDRQAGAHYRMSGFSLRTGALGDDKPVPLELETLLEDVAAGTRTAIDMGATAAIDLEAERYVFDDLDLLLTIQSADREQPVRIRAPQLSMDLANQTLQLDEYSVELAKLETRGALSARGILEDPVFDGSLSVAEFSPAELMRALQMEAPVTADPQVLQRASINANLSGSGTQLTLSDFTMELDQSRFAGEMSIRDFDRPAIGFTLEVDEIDLDRYLEPAAEDSGSEEVAMPQQELQGQEVRGQLNAGKLRMAGLEFSDAEVGIAIRDGKLRLNPLTAGFYDGRYSGDIALDGSGTVPVLSLDEKIDAITFQRLVADLVDNESLSGTAQGHVRLTGRGKSSDEVLGSLQGDLALTLDEGALEGINIWHEIRRGMALYKGLPPPEPEPKRTVFSRMQVAADVADGVVTTRTLVGELPFLTVRGDGAIDLGQSRVDLGLVAEVRNAPELAADPLGSELGGRSLPFRISGPLEDPKLSVDWEALLKSEATDMLLDKLGLGAKESGQETEDGGTEEAAPQDALEETAKGALFDLLKGKDKDKDGG